MKNNDLIILKEGTFIYKNKHYVLCELCVPGVFGKATHDVIGIFECSEEEGNEYIFIDYFYGANFTDRDTLLKIAVDYINEKGR